MIFCSFSAISQESIYKIQINDIKGNLIDLNKFKGKYLLLVNVASKCGFTKQYQSLEKLYQKYKDNLIVIGLPCNQFGGQEPGSEEEIHQFCSNEYNISFLLTEKISVKGKDQHDLYSWLTDVKLNGVSNSSVKWNFQKYIISPKGELINYFYSITDPMSPKITSIFQ